MNKAFGKTPSIDIDAVLQDTYLLVVELQQHASPKDGEELWAHCAEQVAYCRNQLADAGVSQRAINQISYAQCALLDEAVMRNAAPQSPSRAVWTAKPLQAHFFSRHQAGEQLYEDIREALAEPAPDVRVLTCYHRVLMLGFLGRYREENAPEREHLLTTLSEYVEPLSSAQDAPLLVRAAGGGWRRWLGSSWLHVVAAAAVLAVVWILLHQLLVDTVGSLLHGQV